MWIDLAHMMQGSVRVTDDHEVVVGCVLGLVGNSGSSDGPLLHIHAQTPGTTDSPLGGEPLPISFDDRYLARNQRIEGRMPELKPVGSNGGRPCHVLGTPSS
ncbi:MAG: hypothetical protein EA421_17145 [Gemmatimonadales bacterium]|nr:MAG: hypothetical protein EA421_17145 [Gemmatimonadales bacterium]